MLFWALQVLLIPNTTVNQALTYTTYHMFLFFSPCQVYTRLCIPLPISHKITNGFSVTLIQCEVDLGKKLLLVNICLCQTWFTILMSM